jgi:uncharacterized protein (DUF58 family)
MLAKRLKKNRQSDQTQLFSERRLEAKLVPVTAIIFGALYALSGYRGWLVFMIGLLGVWFVAAIWVQVLNRGLRVERKIHLAWAQVGDSVPEEIVITNKGRLPAIWVEIIDKSDSLSDPIRLVTDVEALSSRRRHPIHQFKRRGLYTLGPTLLKTGDAFGIYSLSLYDHHASSILVTPPQLALSHLNIATGGWAGDRQQHVQSAEREISDAGVRDYSPGDSMRRIHWHASAHSDSLIVRQLQSAASADWWIFVDMEREVQAGIGQDSTLELSIVLAASLTSRGLREHRHVGLAMAAPRLILHEPRSGSPHHWSMLRSLAVAQAGNRTLAQLLNMSRPNLTASLIIITPSTDLTWIAAIDKQHKHTGVTALLIDPVEFGASANQRRVSDALTRRGIPYTYMPRLLLEEAYAASLRDEHGLKKGLITSRRFVERSKSAWQSMD